MRGFERKGEIEDKLSGKQATPVVLPAGGVLGGKRAIASAHQVRDVQSSSIGVQIQQKIGKFLGNKLEEAVNVQQERSLLDGQIAQQQGKAFDQVEMDGDKWALEGYRVMQAQQLSSTVLAAQRQEIRQGAYEMDPEQYREHLSNRTMEILSSAPDARTSQLARDQLLKQIPVLVDEHMVRNMQYREDMNFRNLESSIDVLGRDPTSIGDLLSAVRGGENSVSAGLSDTRRRAAVISGLQRAFDNDNPESYGALVEAGLLPENLNLSETNALNRARRQFERRREGEYVAELFEAEQELISRAEEGELEPEDAVEALASISAEHGMTLSAQKAGAIYLTARDGARTSRITRSALIDAAGMRGDIDTQADMIISSLEHTESSGVSDALRTNKDGRQYGGTLQIGQQRLEDWSKATGLPKPDLSEFMSNTELQQKINRWHIEDLLSTIKEGELKGFIGRKIGDVPVTLSGMVAVAHLGGKDGLRKFLETGGKYNPSDELGTSLMDYLKRHNTVNEEEMFSPGQRAQRAVQMRDQVIKRVAAQSQALSRPSRDGDDELFRNDLISREEWEQRNRKRSSRYNVDRTIGVIEHEAEVLSDIAVANIETSIDKDTYDRTLDYKMGVEEARATFMEDARKVEEGEMNPLGLEQSSETFFQAIRDLSDRTGITPKIPDIIRDVRSISANATRAMKSARKWHEDQVIIEDAIRKRTPENLDKKLTKRAVMQKDKQLQQLSTDMVARGELDPEKQQDWIRVRRNKFLGHTGIVHAETRNIINSYLDRGPLDGNSEVLPGYVEAIETYREIADISPKVADKYIDPQNRVALDVILHNAVNGPVEDAARNWGLRQANPEAVNNPETFFGRDSVQKSMEDAIDGFLEKRDIGVFQALWKNTSSLSQVRDMTQIDRDRIFSEENRSILRSELRNELESSFRLDPRGRATELVDSAARRLEDRSTVVGGQLVVLPVRKSLSDMFFGSNHEFSQLDGVYNTAIMQWLRSPEVRDRYPYLDQTTAAEFLNGIIPDEVFGYRLQEEDAGNLSDAISTIVRGVRPFSVSVNGLTGQMYMEVSNPKGGHYDTIVLPADEIGAMYMKNHRMDMRNLSPSAEDMSSLVP